MNRTTKTVINRQKHTRRSQLGGFKVRSLCIQLGGVRSLCTLLGCFKVRSTTYIMLPIVVEMQSIRHAGGVFNENGNGGKIEVDATVKIHTDSDLQMQDVVKVLENIMRRQRERRPPTTRNYALELPTFGAIAGVSPTEVQWKSLALGEPP